ncbi:hypothetical protein LSAT2_015928 [Lamellibrachia satsuma]|nr:hypothetical protein LSAT2_015928 [Lamellibrachia satsuma]
MIHVLQNIIKKLQPNVNSQDNVSNKHYKRICSSSMTKYTGLFVLLVLLVQPCGAWMSSTAISECSGEPYDKNSYICCAGRLHERPAEWDDDDVSCCVQELYQAGTHRCCYTSTGKMSSRGQKTWKATLVYLSKVSSPPVSLSVQLFPAHTNKSVVGTSNFLPTYLPTLLRTAAPACDILCTSLLLPPSTHTVALIQVVVVVVEVEVVTVTVTLVSIAVHPVA